jgi:hypothetical protein
MRRLAIWAAVTGTAVALAVSSAAAPAPTTWTHGYDVSWPQCSGTSAAHVPGGSPSFVVLGLTHGTGHTTNPCLPSQVSWARAHGARIGTYLVPSYPTGAQLAVASPDCRTLSCRLRADGRGQATDALRTMRKVGLDAPMVWVDVEFRSPSWPRSTTHNRAVLDGVFAGLDKAGLRYGVYTTSYMWGVITGGWQVDVPNWLPSGDGSPASAKGMCDTTGTGGTTWLVQYTREWDEDLTCPVMDPIPARHGRLWAYRHTTLSLGSAGQPVVALQGALHIARTGSYDLPTSLAVTQFQQAHGLATDLKVDEDDWRVLGAFRSWGGRPFLLDAMTTR